MADFCKQCSLDMWGPTIENDMKGITKEADTKLGLYVVVLCEGCGPCQVDHEGTCVSPDCSEQHGVTPTK